jgi:hypothetical protein
MNTVEMLLLALAGLGFVVGISFGIYAFAPTSFFAHATAHGRYQWLNRA